MRGYPGGKAQSGPAYPESDSAAPPLLFDILEDPFENRNLADSAPSDVARLTGELHRLIGVA